MSVHRLFPYIFIPYVAALLLIFAFIIRNSVQ